MIIAQHLYEGNVGNIPGHTGGLITYMRTDSLNLSTVATSAAKMAWPYRLSAAINHHS